MKFYIRRENEDYLSRFFILDDLGKEKYKVKGLNVKLGEQFAIMDNNIKLASIRKLSFPFIGIYHISHAKKEIGLMENRICATNPSYHIIGINWTLKNGTSPYSFSLLAGNGDIIMKQSKVWGIFGESYELEIFIEKFEIKCLCIAICVDSLLICERKLPALN
ncbi:MAG: hypothetical protein LBJ95_01335 [Oscillospiraceae bacterium]|jgi:uncharacterized protein YxjI|nr:hypothetical protein [Oscillospiraceae bacterium]